MKKEEFDIILSKNRIARELKEMYSLVAEYTKEKSWLRVPESVLFDFDEIEKKTGIANQPTGRDILTSEIDI